MAKAKDVFALDAFAVMAHFEAESGGEKVKELLKNAESGGITLAMSLINVGELVYLLSREQGRGKAQSMLDDLHSLPITFHEATEDRILAVAWLKAEYPISYADAFAVSLAREPGAFLVTGDPELRRLGNIVDIFWLE